mgnify:CR=1 FL=1
MKQQILAIIIERFIATGEPVGSKTIMNHVQASSATIRNEMAELEKQGYLEQPHTSAGRVPTYNGYRLYVDQIMEQNPLSDEEKEIAEKIFFEKCNQVYMEINHYVTKDMYYNLMNKVIYLDNAATTKPSEVALEKAKVFNEQYFFNPSALYHGGLDCAKQIKLAKESILKRLYAGL